MDLLTNRTNSEVDYVAKLVVMQAEQVASWFGLYFISADKICFPKVLLQARFMYESLRGIDYWESSVRFERRALSVLGRFVPAHFRCAYNVTKTTRGRLPCRITGFYKRLEAPQ